MTIDNEMEHNPEENQIWQYLEWQPSSEQVKKLTQYQYLLQKWNQKVNLTRLINGQDFWVSQILDSILPFKNELKNQFRSFKAIDVGTGCGLPGLAIAILFPKSSITLVDSIKINTSTNTKY